MSDVRETINTEIGEQPGIHFNELVRRLDIAPGQVQYHVRRLISTNRIEKEPVWGRTHYFPSEFDIRDRKAIAVLRRESACSIMIQILNAKSIAPDRLASDLGLARSTVEYHVERLIDVGLIEKRYSTDGTAFVSIKNRDQVLRLLDVVEPRLYDQLSDRFDRLIDSLFE